MHLYNTYFDFLETARHSCSPSSAQQLIRLGTSVSNISGHRNTGYPVQPVYFLLNLPEGKYIAMQPSVESLCGFSAKYLMDAGVKMIVNQYHPRDGEIYFGDIFFKNLDFLRRQPVDRHPHFTFSYNYRLRTKSGAYRAVLQRMTALQSSPDGTPILLLIALTDITCFKTDTRIIHGISEWGNTQNVFRKVYFVREEESMLTKREVEVLKWMAEGLSSKTIADRLFLSIHTVHNHRKNMLDKTNCKSTAELLQYAVDSGLL